MALVIKGSSSGQITVDVPASAGTNTLTLPATTGTVLDTNSALASSKLSGALPAIDGSALTGIATGLSQSAFSQNENGYMTFSNGLIIQWGRASSLANGGVRDVNFPITFPSACWSVSACWTVQSSGSFHSAFPTITTTKFTAHNVTGVTQGVYFIAVGN